MIKITFPDGSVREYEQGVTGLQIAESISPALARDVLACGVNGETVELNRPINADSTVQLYKWEDDEGKHAFWHTSAHLLAEALQELYPGIQFGFGPAVENGFFYDVLLKDGEAIKEGDFPKIEDKMRELASKKEPVVRKEVSKADALKEFAADGQTYKCEHIEQDLEDGSITTYTQGAFTDLCKGPHLLNTGLIKAIKLTSVAGAFWRGDATREQMQRLADILEKTLDIESILQMAESAKEMEDDMPKSLKQLFTDPHVQKIRTQRPQIAVAKDEAFCFLYEDNLKLLEELGAEITFFSPLHDAKVPENTDGLLLPGGYPELFAAELSENSEMLASIRSCEKKAIPILAECGGFMYLHQEMQDMEGKTYPMAGVINAAAYRTEKLGRFGYITLDLNEEQAEARNIWQQSFPVRAHEFHYFDSTDPGSACLAKKPAGKRSWSCSYAKDGSLMGFPHLYYYSNPMFAFRFLENCMAKKLEREKVS